MQENNGINNLTRRFYKEVSEELSKEEWEREYYRFIDLSQLPNQEKYKHINSNFEATLASHMCHPDRKFVTS